MSESPTEGDKAMSGEAAELLDQIESALLRAGNGLSSEAEGLEEINHNLDEIDNGLKCALITLRTFRRRHLAEHRLDDEPVTEEVYLQYGFRVDDSNESNGGGRWFVWSGEPDVQLAVLEEELTSIKIENAYGSGPWVNGITTVGQLRRLLSALGIETGEETDE